MGIGGGCGILYFVNVIPILGLIAILHIASVLVVSLLFASIGSIKCSPLKRAPG
jgi:hypothetical protein